MDTGESQLTNNHPSTNSKSSRRNVKQRYNVMTDKTTCDEVVNIASPDIKHKKVVAIVASPNDMMNVVLKCDQLQPHLK